MSFSVAAAGGRFEPSLRGVDARPSGGPSEAGWAARGRRGAVVRRRRGERGAACCGPGDMALPQRPLRPLPFSACHAFPPLRPSCKPPSFFLPPTSSLPPSLLPPSSIQVGACTEERRQPDTTDRGAHRESGRSAASAPARPPAHRAPRERGPRLRRKVPPVLEVPPGPCLLPLPLVSPHARPLVPPPFCLAPSCPVAPACCLPLTSSLLLPPCCLPPAPSSSLPPSRPSLPALLPPPSSPLLLPPAHACLLLAPGFC